jgi:RNA polymerase sigma-70 factor (ECF subfamily)
MSDTWTQAGTSPDDLLARWRRDGRPADLAALFDAVGPELFRVALHLCRDAATAEDVLQDTFVVVLERAHLWDPSRPAMPWLVGILKNQAAMARRRAARSPDPDRAPAPSSPLDPAFEAAEAEERERLREVLKSLPEPYRGVALLRWRYGLDPAEIAEVQGVPPGTVRSWLSRALSRIKVSMAALPALLLVLRPERGLDGVRTAILRRAVARHLPEPAEVVASGSVVVRALAGVPVGRALLAASVAVVAVGSVGWYLFGGDDGVGDSVGLPVPLQVATAPPAPKAAVAAPAPAAAPVVAAAPKPAEEPFDGVELEVLVKDAAGNLAVGAEVTVWRPRSNLPSDRVKYYEVPPFPGQVSVAPAFADVSGRARLRIGKPDLGPRNTELDALWIHAVKGGEAAMAVLKDLPATGTAKRELTLETAGRIHGTLRWKSGEVLPGGLVYLSFTPPLFLAVRTDENGLFRFPLVPASRFDGLRYFVHARDALSNEKVLPREAIDGPGLDVVAEPQWTLRGRCVDSKGVPLPDLPVVARVDQSVTSEFERRTKTAADGTFALERMDGRYSALRVEGGELGIYSRNPILAFGEAGVDVGDVILGKKAELSGTVLLEGGSAARGALVLLVPGKLAGDTILAYVATDEEGRFSFQVADNRSGDQFRVYVLPGEAENGVPVLDMAKGRMNARFVADAQTRGYTRGPIVLGGAPLRIVLGGLRVRFRFLDAETGVAEKLKIFKATVHARGTEWTPEKGYQAGIKADTANEYSPCIDVLKPGIFCPEVEVDGYSCEFPESVEVTEEKETVVEVRLRKK